MVLEPQKRLKILDSRTGSLLKISLESLLAWEGKQLFDAHEKWDITACRSNLWGGSSDYHPYNFGA